MPKPCRHQGGSTYWRVVCRRRPGRTGSLLAYLLILVSATPPGAEAATFGNTNLQTSTLNTENQISAGRFASSSDGTADSITVYLDFGGENDVFKIRCALYNYNGGVPTLVDTTAEQSVDCGVLCADGWRSFALINRPGVSSSATYDLCVWVSSSAVDNASVRVNSGQSGHAVDYQSVAYGAWPATLTESTLSNYVMSIYCTYTTGTAASRPARRRAVTGKLGRADTPMSQFAGVGPDE